jgi:hypothetical protein
MARTALTKVTPQGPYIQGQPAANSLDFTFSASDSANGNSFPASGKELLLVQNTDAGAQSFTVRSVPDALGRSQDVTTYTMQTGEFAVFKLDQQVGWVQADGNVYLDSSNNNIKFAVVRL